MVVFWNAVVTHSLALASTQSHLKRHMERFLRKAKGTPLNFSWIRCSRGSHQPSTTDLIYPHTLSRSLSLVIIFYVEQSAAPQTKLHISCHLLELESFRWHVGWGIEPVRSPLDGLGNKVWVLINIIRWEELIDDFISQFVDVLILMIL